MFSMLSYLLLRPTLRHRPVSNIPMFLRPHGLLPYREVIESGRVASLDGSARNEEPLVINPVNGLGRQVLMPGDFEGASIHTVGGVRDGPIGPIATLASQYFYDI